MATRPSGFDLGSDNEEIGEIQVTADASEAKAEKAKAANFQSYSEEQRQKLIRLANATNIQLEHVLSVYDTDGAALFCLLC